VLGHTCTCQACDQPALTRVGLLKLASGAIRFILFFGEPATTLGSPQTNPYNGIIQRNVFGLKPAPRAEPVSDYAQQPPARIILTGITTILGDSRVLLKAPPPVGKPGEPQPEKSYKAIE
jgi:hypothetical protein